MKLKRLVYELQLGKLVNQRALNRQERKERITESIIQFIEENYDE